MAGERDEPLAAYNRMRRFDRTPEPEGKPGETGEHLAFVVQKHDATRVHYDFRLEHGGVMWSWAVPQGPSYDPEVKRLAVHVEDHPIAYNDFEGVIPKGEYGGGTVIVWDRGTWAPREDPAFGLEKGHLSFDLHGERLLGHWHLVRLKEKEGEGDNWLLFKGKDGLQSAEVDVTALDTSVLSGRTLAEVAAEPHRVWRSGKGVVGPVDPSEIDGAVRADLPRFVDPMLCQAVDRPPDGEGWVHEIKYDGYRMQAPIDGDEVRLFTRRGNDWTAKLGHLAEALAVLPVNSALLDGEIVVLEPGGASDFGLLVKALSANDQAAMTFMVFDLLYAEGYDLRAVPLHARKDLLKRLLDAAPPQSRQVRYCDHVRGHGPLFFEQVGDLGLEGVVSKQWSAPYASGRGGQWRKAKHLQRQELVITGWTDLEGAGAGTGIGAVLLGGWERGVLRPAGKVGSGFSDTQRAEFMRALQTIGRPDPAVHFEREDQDDLKGVHWVQPLLVAEVSFSGWTHEDRLRHPVFVALREDRDPAEVPRKPGAPVDPPLPEPTAAGRRALSRIKITTPERILWPEIGLTKAELLAYWAAVGEHALAELGDRPLSIVRCPHGITGEQFFQKHAEKGVPDYVKHLSVPEEGPEPFLYVDSVEGLLALAQLNTLELHPWGATVRAPLHPDRVIFDLDPPPDVPWGRVAEAAFWVREALQALGLVPFVRTTGGKGLHVVVPLVPESTWEATRAFARGVAEGLVHRHGDRLTLAHALEGRRGRVYLDVMRNALGATAVGTWSTRARPGAPVAVPVKWDEVVGLGSGARWNVRNLAPRLAHLDADPWEDLSQAARPLPDTGAAS